MHALRRERILARTRTTVSCHFEQPKNSTMTENTARQEIKKFLTDNRDKPVSGLEKVELLKLVSYLSKKVIDDKVDNAISVAEVIKRSAKEQPEASDEWKLLEDDFRVPEAASGGEDAGDSARVNLPKIASICMPGLKTTTFSGSWECDPRKTERYFAGLHELMRVLANASQEYGNMLNMWVGANTRNPAVFNIFTTITASMSDMADAIPIDHDGLHDVIYAAAFPFLSEDKKQEDVSLQHAVLNLRCLVLVLSFSFCVL